MSQPIGVRSAGWSAACTLQLVFGELFSFASRSPSGAALGLLRSLAGEITPLLLYNGGKVCQFSSPPKGRTNDAWLYFLLAGSQSLARPCNTVTISNAGHFFAH